MTAGLGGLMAHTMAADLFSPLFLLHATAVACTTGAHYCMQVGGRPVEASGRPIHHLEEGSSILPRGEYGGQQLHVGDIGRVASSDERAAANPSAGGGRRSRA